jgi:hypothetical protein
MTRLEELLEASEAAERHVRKLEHERFEEEYKLKKRLQEQLDGIFGEPIRTAKEAHAIAKTAWQSEYDRIALESAKPSYPVGTKVQKWISSNYDRKTWIRSKEDIGMVEIITPESKHPATKTYGKARIGEVVVRKLKKDGTPSQNYINVSGGWIGGWDRWRPIDVDYNAEVNKEAIAKKKAEEQAFADAAKEVFGL